MPWPKLLLANPDVIKRVEIAPGVVHMPGYLDREAQCELVEALRDVARVAPFFTPRMPRSGKAFSVRMTNCGVMGWVSDVNGYRYQARHPVTGEPWPEIPKLLRDAWAQILPAAPPPEACLVNYYSTDARMGLHQDRDEEDLSVPVLSLSLGDAAVFRIGGPERGGPTRSCRLQSGDALTFGGAARLSFHGIDRVLAGSSTLLPDGGRINLTLRRVTKA